jgi:hypothetical protein
MTWEIARFTQSVGVPSMPNVRGRNRLDAQWPAQRQRVADGTGLLHRRDDRDVAEMPERGGKRS